MDDEEEKEKKVFRKDLRRYQKMSGVSNGQSSKQRIPISRLIHRYRQDIQQLSNISQPNRYDIVYEPDKWNSNMYIRTTHNCYAYAMNDFNPSRKGFPQPGVKAGLGRPTQADFVCPKVSNRVLADNPNIKVINLDQNCPAGYHKAALVVDPYRDYHFYRLDEDTNLWSHKPGSRPVTNIDDAGNLIYNPLYADRNYENVSLNYDKYCMTFCAPNNSNVL